MYKLITSKSAYWLHVLEKTLKILVIFLSGYHSLSAQESKLWGMTTIGGDYNQGTIFSTDSAGNNYYVEHSFKLYDGASPQHLKLCASDGKFYGLTSTGGANNKGVLFEYDAVNDIYITKIEFDGVNTGSLPFGSLLKTSNGKMYGLTSEGGTFDKGVIFEYIISTNTLVKLFDFDGLQNGGKPYNSLIEATNGKLYGFTSMSYYFDYPNYTNTGVLFEFNPTTNIYTPIRGVAGNPYGSLLQATNGKLYFSKALNSVGTGGVFEYDIETNTLISRYTHQNWRSFGALIQADNNKLYGMAYNNGTNSNAEIFELDLTTSIYTVKHEFNYGHKAYGDLIQASNGKLYGGTYNSLAGANVSGVLFEYDLVSNSFLIQRNLDAREHIKGTLIEDSGKLYGVTLSTTTGNGGTLFEFNLSDNTFTKKLNFNSGREGSNPRGSLIRASNGKLYGMTSTGGLNNLGVIFEFDTSVGLLTKKFDFDGVNGSMPQGSLLQASNGKLYGMTAGGVLNPPDNGVGVIFEYDLQNNAFTKLHNFTQDDGYSPKGSLIQATNGKLYGLTSDGGSTSFNGSLFEYDIINNIFTKKYSFNQSESGSHPNGDLLQATNGKLYGVTQEGGGTQNGYFSQGVLFEYDITTNTYLNKHRFIDSNSQSVRMPQRNIIQGANGKLYGVTKYGGQSGNGVIFEFDPNSSVVATSIFHFYSNGDDKSSLVQSSNGNLYGFTQGTFSSGKLYEFNATTNTYVVKASNSSFESQTICGGLLEVPNGALSVDEFKNVDDRAVFFPNPTNGIVNMRFAKEYKCYVELIDMRGRTVFLKSYESITDGVLDINTDRGVYIVKVNFADGKTISRKIIKI